VVAVMIKLKDILSEIGTDPKTVFGNIVFGDPDNYPSSPFRELQGFGYESEPNTEDEEEIFNMLQAWVDGSNMIELYNKIYANYNLFKRAASIYPKIFKPQTPNGTDLYRGVSNASKSLIEQLQNSSHKDFDVFEHDDTLYKYKTPINYTPRSNVQSWSTNLFTAIQFSQLNDFVGGVVLTTKQNDEYLFNQEVLRLLSLNKFNEEEVIHFGKTFSNDVYVIIHRKVYRQIMFGDKA
jgi:hypothetical protein